MANLTLLESLIEEDFGLTIQDNNWARGIEHDSLVIDRKKQTFHWNSQNIHGDAYIYLTEVRHWSPVDSREWLRKGNFSTTFIYEIRNKEEVIVYPKLVKVFNQNLMNADKEYFYKRTITDETMSRYDLGYHNGFYMIPIMQDYVLKQFQMRQDVPAKKITNYYRDAGGFLYNSDILKYINKVIFVEGVTSCLVLNQNGIPTVSSNTGAVGFKTEWFSNFIHQDKIYLCYDNDSAGRSGALRTAKILGENRCKIYTFDGYEEHYDANDFFIDGGTTEQFMALLRDNGKYSFELERKEKRNGLLQDSRNKKW